MASKALGGQLFLKVDGTQYRINGTWSVQPNNTKNTGKPGRSGDIPGYTVETIVPYFEGNATDYGGLSVQALMNITNSTITCELINGKVYTLIGAWYAGDSKIDVTTADIPLRFEGTVCNEALSA